MDNKELYCRDVRYCIDRPIFYEQELGTTKPSPNRSIQSIVSSATRKIRCSSSAAKCLLFQFIPILQWLPCYPVKDWLLGDIVSGVSVGILQLPQGLAYAYLAGVPAIYGLYSSFFPVFVYSFFGTSRHVSVGTFAVVSIMIGSSTESLVPNDNFILPGNETVIDIVARDKARVELVAAMTLLVGLFQIILGLVQFGFVVTYLSEPLVRGYTTAATIHVTASQLKHIFGLPLSEQSQPLSLIYNLISLFRRIHRTNIGTLVISLISLFCLFCVKEVNRRLQSKLCMPIPIELALLIISTGISYGVGLNEKYGIGVVGDIPSGLAAPALPNTDLFMDVIGNAFAIAVVGYTITISLGRMFAIKHGYKVDSNQELIALGISNLTGSFFHCLAVTASMSRSLVQENTGGNTQIAGSVSAFIILIIIIQAVELFKCLPQAILSAIVIANLKGMYLQFMDIPVLWRANKCDLLIWLVTFFSTICLNLDIGLAVSVIFGLFTVTFRTQLAHYSVLGQVAETDIYRDAEENMMAKEIPRVKIFRASAPIYFANAELFVKALKVKMGANVDKLIEKKKKAIQKRKKGLQRVVNLAKMILAKTQKGSGLEFLTNADGLIGSLKSISESIPQGSPSLCSLGLQRLEFTSLILDFSSVSFIDTVGIKMLKRIFEEFHEIEVEVYIGNCPAYVLQQLVNSHFFGDTISPASIFVSIHDAVTYISSNQSSESSSVQEITAI
ncbi:solute carrier family 26 member 6-like [Gastrophryne carolinensis]